MDREKHLFVFSASWCGPCRMMKAHVWSDPNVQKNLDHFHSVNFIDIDDPKNRDVTMAYRVNAVPMIYIVDNKGKPLKVGSTMDVNQTVEFLNYE